MNLGKHGSHHEGESLSNVPTLPQDSLLPALYPDFFVKIQMALHKRSWTMSSEQRKMKDIQPATKMASQQKDKTTGQVSGLKLPKFFWWRYPCPLAALAGGHFFKISNTTATDYVICINSILKP
jgi:hypothetical protein